MLRPLWLLLLLLSLYSCRHEPTRQIMQNLHSLEDVQRVYRRLLWPPWQIPRTYVSAEDDVHLYFEYTRVILGEEPDAAYIASWQATSDPREISRLQRALTHKSGLRLPYRDVHIVLPPVTLLVLLLPRLVCSTLGGYRIAFAGLMALLHLGSLFLIYGIARRLSPASPAAPKPQRDATELALLSRLSRRLLFATACLGPLLVGRYDALPIFFVVAALFALVHGWAATAALLILLGAGAKLFPLYLVPVWTALLWGRGRAGRPLLVRFVAPFLLLSLAAAAYMLARGQTPQLLLGALLLFGQRPIQIESLLGSILRCAGSGLVFSYGSDNVALVRALFLPQLLDGLSLLLTLLLSLRAARAVRAPSPPGPDPDPSRAAFRTLCQYTTATVLLIFVSTKLLSPQYLIWALPLVVLAAEWEAGDPVQPGRVLPLYCTALLLTQVYFPFMFGLLTQGRWPLLWLVLLRNLLLLATLLCLLFPGTWGLRRSARPPLIA